MQGFLEALSSLRLVGLAGSPCKKSVDGLVTYFLVRVQMRLKQNLPDIDYAMGEPFIIMPRSKREMMIFLISCRLTPVGVNFQHMNRA